MTTPETAHPAETRAAPKLLDTPVLDVVDGVEPTHRCITVERYEAMCEAWDILRAWDAWLLLEGDQGDLRVDLLVETSGRTATFFGSQDWNPTARNDGDR